MNTLSQRIKYAKRELTALKTVHSRGLGLIKIYSRTINAGNPPGSGFWWISLDITFDVSAYPFIQVYRRRNSLSEGWASDANEFEYTDNGWRAGFRTEVLSSESSFQFTVYSTSPIKTLNYSWAPEA